MNGYCSDCGALATGICRSCLANEVNRQRRSSRAMARHYGRIALRSAVAFGAGALVAYGCLVAIRVVLLTGAP